MTLTGEPQEINFINGRDTSRAGVPQKKVVVDVLFDTGTAETQSQTDAERKIAPGPQKWAEAETGKDPRGSWRYLSPKAPLWWCV